MFKPEQLPRQLADAIDMVGSLPCREIATRCRPTSGPLGCRTRSISSTAPRPHLRKFLAHFDAAGDGHTLHAARSTAAWVRGALSISGGEATERVHLARSARTFLAPSMRLLSEGALSYEQVRSIERGVRTLPEQHREHAVAVLNEAAKGLDVAQLRQAVRHLQNVVDPDGSAKTAAERFDRRYLHLSPCSMAWWHSTACSMESRLPCSTLHLSPSSFLPVLMMSARRRNGEPTASSTSLAWQWSRPNWQYGGTRPQLSILCPC